jgi:hypothetical protein
MKKWISPLSILCLLNSISPCLAAENSDFDSPQNRMRAHLMVEEENQREMIATDQSLALPDSAACKLFSVEVRKHLFNRAVNRGAYQAWEWDGPRNGAFSSQKDDRFTSWNKICDTLTITSTEVQFGPFTYHGTGFKICIGELEKDLHELKYGTRVKRTYDEYSRSFIYYIEVIDLTRPEIKPLNMVDYFFKNSAQN